MIALEALRLGQPPTQAIAHWSAGNSAHLAAFLQRPRVGLNLLSGPVGSGKSHTLQWLRHQGLQAGYAVAWLQAWPGCGSLEAPLACLGQLWQALEMPTATLGTDRQGPVGLFQHLAAFLAQPHPALSPDWQSSLQAADWQSLPPWPEPELYLMLRGWLQAETTLASPARDYLRAEISDSLQYPDSGAARQGAWLDSVLPLLGADFAYGDGPPQAPNTALQRCLAQIQQLQLWLQASGLQGLLLILEGHDSLLLQLEASELAAALQSWEALCAPQFPCPVLLSMQPDFREQLTRRLLHHGLWHCNSNLLDQPLLPLLQATAREWRSWVQALGQALGQEAHAALALTAPTAPAETRGFVQQVLRQFDC